MGRRWIGGLAVAAVIGVVLTPVGARADRAEASAIYKKAMRAYRAGNIEKALDLFQRSEDADPTYPYPSLALARIYHQLFEQDMTHYREAEQAYDRVGLLLRVEPPGPTEQALYQAYYFQGLLLLKGGEYERALRAFDQFLELSPDFYAPELVHNARGVALYALDRFDAAVAAFRKALEIDPDYAEARFNLRSVYTRLSTYNEAVALSRAGRDEIALKRLAQLREFAPRFLPGRRLEAQTLARLGRKHEAERVYREILALDPADPLTYGVRLDLARLLADEGRRVEALALCKENLERFPRIADERARKATEALLVRLGGAP
ncbi:tetratricopeptide repeat protein [Deferrisoma palaeochoriense]